MTDAQSGGLFTAQFLGSSVGTIIFGRLVLRGGISPRPGPWSDFHGAGAGYNAARVVATGDRGSDGLGHRAGIDHPHGKSAGRVRESVPSSSSQPAQLLLKRGGCALPIPARALPAPPAGVHVSAAEETEEPRRIASALVVVLATGFVSTRFFSLKLGLLVPLGGCLLMLGLYLEKWSSGAEVQSAEIAS